VWTTARDVANSVGKRPVEIGAISKLDSPAQSVAAVKPKKAPYSAVMLVVYDLARQ